MPLKKELFYPRKIWNFHFKIRKLNYTWRWDKESHFKKTQVQKDKNRYEYRKFIFCTGINGNIMNGKHFNHIKFKWKECKNISLEQTRPHVKKYKNRASKHIN